MLARQHRPLARHRRHGAGRLFGQRHRGRAGGPAPAAGEALQAGRARRGDPRRSSCRTSASPTSASATSRRRRRRSRSASRRLDRAARPLRRGDGRGRDRRAASARAAQQMRAKIATIPDGTYEGEAFVDSDGVVDEPLRIAMQITQDGGRPDAAQLRHGRLVAALPGADEQRDRDHAARRSTSRSSTSSPTCRSTPAPSSRCTIVEPEGTFLYARLSAPGVGLRRRGEPAHRRGGVRRARQGDSRPAVRRAGRHLRQSRRSAATTRRSNRSYVMYVISGGGYGGSPAGDGISQRLLDHRHLEDDADRGHGAALPGAVRGVLAARRLGRRRRASRRLRRQLHASACAAARRAPRW